MRHFIRDLRFAARMLAKAPGFTAIAVLCLALGIGANSTVFSLVDGYWTRPLPVPNPRQLVYLYTATPRSSQESVSYAEFLDYQAGAKCFSGLLATERRGGILAGDGFTDALQSNVVSESYFQVLGIGAQAGRVFTSADAAGPRVLVMSHNLWQRRFGGDPAIVGRTIRINGLYTVIGIAPKDFRGVELWRDSDVWIPLSSWDPTGAEAASRAYRSYTVMGRLRPGVPLEQAQSALTALSTQLERAWPKFNKGCRAVLLTNSERLLRFKLPYILMGIVGLVLLIACANVAGLLLARARGRSYEIGVRLALGASRFRLVSQLMAESALIGVMGAAAGLLLARALISLLPAVVIPPADTSTRYQFLLDGRVLAFTLLVSVLTVLVFGLAPALRTSVAVRNRRNSYSRRVLVVVQMALSIVLLAGAGLLVRTFIYCLNLDPGFTRQDVLVADISPPYDAPGARAFYQKLLDRAHGMPGVLNATLALRAPLSGSGGGLAQNVTIDGHPVLPGDTPPRIKYTVIGLDYFRTMGIALARGRDFDSHDARDAAKVMIVNLTMARRFWPNEDALGKTVNLATVVGVVNDTRINNMDEPPEPYFYLPFAQSRFSSMYLIARTSVDPSVMARQVRAEVAAIDPGVPVLEITSMKLLVRSSVYGAQVSATIVGSLGLIGLLLAAIGLYGVVAYTVAERTREIGIRMALGAQTGDAIRLILRQALLLAGIGAAMGLVLAFYATRLLQDMLIGVSPHDPLTFAAVVALMLSVALLASYVPARRATTIDPMTALRYE